MTANQAKQNPETIGVLFNCPRRWNPWLPPGIQVGHIKSIAERYWNLLALTETGCTCLENHTAMCRILLVPGNCPAKTLAHLDAEYVITYGLSSRDSLTFSSLSAPVICVQRTLVCPDGKTIEPQELPLGTLPESPEILLPLLGVRLLQMPLSEAFIFC